MSVEELWASSWPGVDFVDASPEDRKLFLDHAGSISLYLESHEEISS